jgi:ketosteroid isomerase-like protein
MKRWVGVGLFLFGMVFGGCSSAVDPLTEISEVKVLVDRLRIAQEKEDMTALSALFAQEDDLVLFGIGESERYVGWEAVKGMYQGQMDTIDGLTITISDQSIKVSKGGMAAWVTSLDRLQGKAGENQFHINVKNTVVLEKRNGKWLIVHIHMSKYEAGT